MDDSRVLDNDDTEYPDWMTEMYNKTHFVLHFNPTVNAFNYWMDLPSDTDFYNLQVCVEQELRQKKGTFINQEDIQSQYENTDSTFNNLSKGCCLRKVQAPNANN